MDILVDLDNNILFADEISDLEPFLFHRKVIFILNPGKVCTDPDSYRGLSMLERYFQLYSNILADRMQRVVGAYEWSSTGERLKDTSEY